MAAKKKRRPPNPGGKRGAEKQRRKPRIEHIPRGLRGRFETLLTDDLCTELIERYREGDMIAPTAEACGVRGDLVKEWLQMGCGDTAPEPHARLYAAFRVIEADIRAQCLKDMRDPMLKNAHGIAWYLERRWAEWRTDYVPKPNDVLSLSQITQSSDGGLTRDQALHLARQMAATIDRHPELKAIFDAEGWSKGPKPPALPVGVDDDGEEGPGADDATDDATDVDEGDGELEPDSFDGEFETE